MLWYPRGRHEFMVHFFVSFLFGFKFCLSNVASHGTRTTDHSHGSGGFCRVGFEHCAQTEQVTCAVAQHCCALYSLVCAAAAHRPYPLATIHGPDRGHFAAEAGGVRQLWSHPRPVEWVSRPGQAGQKSGWLLEWHLATV
jgi:hypothetical protein